MLGLPMWTTAFDMEYILNHTLVQLTLRVQCHLKLGCIGMLMATSWNHWRNLDLDGATRPCFPVCSKQRRFLRQGSPSGMKARKWPCWPEIASWGYSELRQTSSLRQSLASAGFYLYPLSFSNSSRIYHLMRSAIPSQMYCTLSKKGHTLPTVFIFGYVYEWLPV